ncbi:MAG: VOC family protein [Lachnospiraceae bacterium]|nr:VOC family protein [Lachnospiraceae bacterium]
MKEKISVIPYLPFKGDCEEAVNTYISAFGGEILFISRWDENNYDMSLEQIGKVMHVEFTIGGSRMAAGDSYDCKEVNTDIKLMLHMDSEEEALHTISVLAEGGTVLSPLSPHPEPDDDGCGSVIKDRFGFTWIITCLNPAKQ